MNIPSLKNRYFRQIRSYDFLNNTLNQYLDCIISRYSNSTNTNILQTLYNYKNSINQISMYQNSNDKIRFFMNIESSLTNLNDETVWVDLLSFFDENILHTQELKNLTTRNTLLTQENLNLINELKTAIEEIKQLQSKMEHLTNINLLQNDEILIIKEMIRDYQKK